MIPGEDDCPIIGEPLKTGVKSKNGQGVPASRKADEVRLYALRGGLTTKMVRTAHFRSHEVFRGDHNVVLHTAVDGFGWHYPVEFLSFISKQLTNLHFTLYGSTNTR